VRNLLFSALILFLQSSYLFAQGGGSCLNFEGGDDWLNCGTNLLNISDSLTVEAWTKAQSSQPAGYSRIVDKYDYYSQEGFDLVTEFLTSGGSAMLDFFATDGSKNSLVGVTQINDNHWHYVVATYNGNAMKIYIDGRLESQNIIGAKTIKASTNFLGIGNNFDGATWFPFNGQIEEVCLWNAALDSSTLLDWMHKRLNASHPYFSNLVGYWKFDEGAGSTTADSSGNGNNGSLTNMDTTASWLSSTVPLATNITETMSNLSAVWVSKDSSSSSIMSIKDNDISEDGTIIFGHNNSSLILDTTDVPTNLGIQQRLDRVWRMEVYGALTGDIIFNTQDLGVTDGNALRLLIDEDGAFVNADTAAGIFNSSDSTFTIPNHNFQHGYYYTLGTMESPTLINHNRTGRLPQTPILEQNYPNPFNPSTTIAYQTKVPGRVVIKIFNTLGQQIETLVNKKQPPGSYSVQWDGTDNIGKKVSSGIYLYQLSLDGVDLVRKMLMLK
jgi:hypothetical protein